jgi:hypothetical protein
MTDTATARPRLTPEQHAEHLLIKEKLKELADTNRRLRKATRSCNDGTLASWRTWRDRMTKKRETTNLLVSYHILRGTGKEGAHAYKPRT